MARKIKAARRPKRFYSDPLKYAVLVLWLHGYSCGQIARRVSPLARERLTRANINAIVRRSPYNQRRAMSDEERQRHLDILKQERLDNGRIEDWVFVAAPIDDGRQK